MWQLCDFGKITSLAATENKRLPPHLHQQFYVTIYVPKSALTSTMAGGWRLDVTRRLLGIDSDVKLALWWEVDGGDERMTDDVDKL